MMKLVVFGLLAFAGICLARLPNKMKSLTCRKYAKGTCVIGGCRPGQTQAGPMKCSDGDGDCCIGTATNTQPSPRLADYCGSTMPTARIVGGSFVPACTFPYSTMVKFKLFFPTDIDPARGNATLCAGALVSDDTVVTTANCVTPVVNPILGLMDSVKVLVGDHDDKLTDNPNNPDLREEKISIQSVKIHPQYSQNTFDNNIAIVKLQKKIKFNNCKMPACLSSPFDQGCNQVADTCTMAGLGTLFSDSTEPFSIPTKADVKVFDRATSKAMVRYISSSFNIGQFSLPVGGLITEPTTPGVRACAFDWGGIITCSKNGRHQLTGLISYHNCLETGSVPIVAVDIDLYKDWIKSCITDFSTC